MQLEVGEWHWIRGTLSIEGASGLLPPASYMDEDEDGWAAYWDVKLRDPDNRNYCLVFWELYHPEGTDTRFRSLLWEKETAHVLYDHGTYLVYLGRGKHLSPGERLLRAVTGPADCSPCSFKPQDIPQVTRMWDEWTSSRVVYVE